jgi:long-chain fatty acid transport protein
MSLGGEWKLNDEFTLRAGYAQDTTPTHDATRTPRLPDADRAWFSVGLTWIAERDVGNQRRLHAHQRRRSGDPAAAVAGHQRQPLVGSYDCRVNLWGLSAQYRF